MLKNLNDDVYEEEIKKVQGVCLVDFYANWCGPCMKLSPILEEIANSRSNNYNVLKVDVDSNPKMADKLNIDTIPTICLYKKGKLIEKKIGYMDKEEIIELVEKYSD